MNAERFQHHLYYPCFYLGLGGNPANDSLNDSRDIDGSSLFADLNDEDEPDVIGGGSDYLKSTIQV